MDPRFRLLTKWRRNMSAGQRSMKVPKHAGWMPGWRSDTQRVEENQLLHMKRKPYPQLVLLALLFWATSHFAAAAQVPFKGEIAGDVIGVPTGQDLNYAVELTGTGKATVLGKATISATQMTDGATGLISGGSITFIDKHGNTLTGTYGGQEFYPPDDPAAVLVSATLTITGGTGKFAGATGSVPIDVVATIQEITEDAVFIETFVATFDGAITLP